MGAHLNGTPGGDRWARVLCGQTGWLSEPLYRVDADCSECTHLKMQTLSRKTRKHPAAPKTNHEIHPSPATPTISRRRAMKHVPRVRPHSPASIDPGVVEKGLLQLSQSVKTTHVTHTDRQTNKIMAPCRHPGTSIEVNEARRPHTCSRPCAFEEKKNRKRKHEKIRPTKSTPRNPQQPGDRDHLETA